jgi:hypothetical protein
MLILLGKRTMQGLRKQQQIPVLRFDISLNDTCQFDE